MSLSVLLVHDDIAAIAAVRRLLGREGFEVVLATSTSDAAISYAHHRPTLVVLAPRVEHGRGGDVLRELVFLAGEHLPLVFLGEGVSGWDAPIAPFPLDGTAFLEQVRSSLGLTPAGLVASAGPDPALEQLAFFEQAAESEDYFTFLGLPRTASGEDVLTAYERLTAVCAPERWEGYSGPALPARLERLRLLFQEAAWALSDDALRAEYGRNLAD